MATSHQPPFVILGGGPAGLAAAYKLAQRGFRNVTVLERAEPGWRQRRQLRHRRHPGGLRQPSPASGDPAGRDERTSADCLATICSIGRVTAAFAFAARWVHFPLKPVDLVTRLPPAFMAGVVGDAVRKPFTATSGEPELCVDSRTRPRPHHLPRLLLSVRPEDLGLSPAALDRRAGQAERVERIDREDGAARAGRASRDAEGPAPGASSIRAVATDRSATRCTGRRSTPARRCSCRPTSRPSRWNDGRVRTSKCASAGADAVFRPHRCSRRFR